MARTRSQTNVPPFKASKKSPKKTPTSISKKQLEQLSKSKEVQQQVKQDNAMLTKELNLPSQATQYKTVVKTLSLMQERYKDYREFEREFCNLFKGENLSMLRIFVHTAHQGRTPYHVFFHENGAEKSKSQVCKEASKIAFQHIHGKFFRMLGYLSKTSAIISTSLLYVLTMFSLHGLIHVNLGILLPGFKISEGTVILGALSTLALAPAYLLDLFLNTTYSILMYRLLEEGLTKETKQTMKAAAKMADEKETYYIQHVHSPKDPEINKLCKGKHQSVKAFRKGLIKRANEGVGWFRRKRRHLLAVHFMKPNGQLRDSIEEICTVLSNVE